MKQIERCGLQWNTSKWNTRFQEGSHIHCRLTAKRSVKSIRAKIDTDPNIKGGPFVQALGVKALGPRRRILTAAANIPGATTLPAVPIRPALAADIANTAAAGMFTLDDIGHSKGPSTSHDYNITKAHSDCRLFTSIPGLTGSASP